MKEEWSVKELFEYFGTDDIPEDSKAGYLIEQGREQGLEPGRDRALEQGG